MNEFENNLPEDKVKKFKGYQHRLDVLEDYAFKHQFDDGAFDREWRKREALKEAFATALLREPKVKVVNLTRSDVHVSAKISRKVFGVYLSGEQFEKVKATSTI